ncbi:MAG: PAS domain-containing protein [candidate division Zixibacteria bacterium]|nr:PAS domain-containing protein [candidate division Zixibacteria bacterium]
MKKDDKLPLKGLAQIRSSLVNTLLIVFAIAALPTVLVSMARALETGWWNIMYLHAGLLGLSIVIVALRNRLTYSARATFIIASLLVASVAGLITYGLIGLGLPLLISFCVLSIVLFGNRMGILSIALAVLLLALLTTSVHYGILTFEIDTIFYQQAITSWIGALVGFAFLISLLGFAISYIGKHLLFANQSMLSLMSSLETRNEHLKSEIAVRKVAEQAARVSETRLTAFFEGAPVGMVVFNDQLEYLKINDALAEINGISAEDHIGKTMQEVVPHVASTIAEMYNEILKTGQSVLNIEVSGEVPSNPGIKRHWIASQFRIPEGEPETYSVGAVVIETTELRRAEEERAKLESRLRQQQKLESIGTLAGGVAHEINNPINGIMNYAQLIDDRLDPENPLREYAGEIVRESRRVAKIVLNLLTFARQDKEPHSPAKISDNVNDTLTLIRTIIRGDQITLDVDVPDDLPKIKCRSQQIQQVLMNLLTNGRDALNLRYPEHDPDKIMKVTARTFEKEGRTWVRTTVEDHGAGIPDKIRGRVFDPFFTTKDRTKGTGLGLSISHGIVRDHNGELTFECEAGQYTRFHLDLPTDNGWTFEGEQK